MNKTKIEWCDSTWNPVTGCRHKCEYCYARRIAERFRPFDLPHLTEAGVLHGINELASPIITECKDGKERICAYPYGFEPTLHRYRLGEYEKKAGRTIFVCSMADLFGAWVPDRWIEEVFEACEAAPQHRYLFLTKNPQRYGELARAGKLPQRDNMWYGSTLDSMSAKRYPGRLLDNTFISIEPLTEYMDVGLGSFGGDKWVVIGAETGNRKDKVTPKKEWVDKICEAADLTQMAVFMKDSLIPIVGEANMRREFPWDKERRKESGKSAGQTAAQDTLAPAT